MEPGVERGFASETPGTRAEIYCPLKAGERTCQAPSRIFNRTSAKAGNLFLSHKSRLDLNCPPTASWWNFALCNPLLRLNLNNPRTSERGIPGFVRKANWTRGE